MWRDLDSVAFSNSGVETGAPMLVVPTVGDTPALSAEATPSASATPSWISSLSTSSIASDMAAAVVNGVVAAAGLTKLLTDLAATLSSSTLTSAEFHDLQTIAANLNNGLSTSSYLSYAFNALVNGNAANATWTGGGANTVALGNLAAGATQTRLNELVGKWFLGTDLPNSYVDVSGSAPFTVTYSTVTNALFGASGPSMNDINQGVLGDCYFLASCAEVAEMNPSYIQSMFVNNGNGTYGVRFYYDGSPEYVTVNLSLADGGTKFNQATDIWASLAETAWAEFQAINLDTGNSGADAYNYGNSWSTIGNGGDIANALEALTGASVISEFDPNGTSWNDYTYNSSLNWTGYSDLGLSTQSVLASIEAALASHDDVDVSSTTNAYDASGKRTLIASHVLSVYGYDSATGMLELRNPWGTKSGQNWDTTFEVSLATLLADDDWVEFDNAGATSALPNPATTAEYLSNISAYDSLVGAIQISDAAAAVAANLDALNADSHITSITLTGSGVPVLNLTAAQASNDSVALGKIANSAYEVNVSGAHTYYIDAGPLVTLTDTSATFKLSSGADAVVTGSNNTFISTGGATYTVNGNDEVISAAGGDTITLSASSTGDQITGAGVDTVVLPNSYSNYTIKQITGGVTVTNTSTDSSNTLTNIAQIEFSDITLVFDLHSAEDTLVYELYQAAYDRTPDNAGFRYWANVGDANHLSALTLADAFLTAPEFTQDYGSNPTNTHYVTELYTNVLGRAPDAGGLSYWIGQANAGQPRDQLLVDFATCAENQNRIAPHISNGYWTTT